MVDAVNRGLNRRILTHLLKENATAAAVHAVAGLLFIGASLCFSAFLAGYFGGLPKFAEHYLHGLSKELLLILATVASLVALVSRFAEVLIEAYVTVEEERFFAKRLRAETALRPAGGNTVRASNYYGRLAMVVVKAASTFAVIIVAFFFLFITLPLPYAAGATGLILVGSGALFVAMRFAAAAMERSANGLLTYAKAASAWKANPSVPDSEEVNLYFRHYYKRIALASVFSYTSIMFSLGLCLVIVAVSTTYDLSVGFGEIFVVFFVLTSFFGLVGKLLGSIVRCSAFLHVLRPYFSHTATGGEYVISPDVADELLT